MIFRFGSAEALTGRVTAAEFAGDMLMRGTAKHTRQQIQDEFDRLKARVSVNGSADAAHPFRSKPSAPICRMSCGLSRKS